MGLEGTASSYILAALPAGSGGGGEGSRLASEAALSGLLPAVGYRRLPKALASALQTLAPDRLVKKGANLLATIISASKARHGTLRGLALRSR